MPTIRRAIAAVLGLFQRRRLEAELDEELRFHLAMEAEAQMRQGTSREEAERHAMLHLGGLESTKEAARSARGYRRLEVLGQDMRFTLRLLRRNPGYASAVVVALALGIGANTAIFSLVRGVLLRDLPYQEPGRLVVLHQRERLTAEGGDQGFSVPDIEDLRRRNHSFSGLAEYHSMWFNLLGRTDPERVQTGVVSANFFGVLGTRAILGRTFSPEDDRPGAQPVLVFSHAYWQRSWGGDPAVIGKTLEMNDHPHRVIGVLPPVPQYPDDNDLWMPTSACPFRSDPHLVANRQGRGFNVFGRLRPGTTLAQARRDLGAINRTLLADYPGDYPTGGYRIEAAQLLTELTERARPTLWLLLATVLLVLLIVCANVANLQLARLSCRDDEMGVRAALGAGRGRLLRQLLTESVILALLGAALGVGVAAAMLKALIAFAARFTARTGDIALDGWVLVFTVSIAVFAGLVSGTLPAVMASRGIASALRAGGSGRPGDAKRLRMRAVLAGVQVAVSFLLLVSAGLTLRSIWKLQAVDAGFNAENVLALTIDLDWAHYKTPQLRRTFHRALLARARTLPGVAAAAYSSNYPLDGIGRGTAGVRVEGRTVTDANLPQAGFRIASNDVFNALGIRIERGRGFEDTDRDGAPHVAVLGHALAMRLFGQEDPLGRRIAFGSQKPPLWHTVIGVIADVRDQALDQDPGGAFWVALDQNPALAGSLLLRSQREPVALTAAARAIVRDIDLRQPVGRVQTLETARSASLAAPRLTTILLSAFAALALAVTVIGLGGVVAFGVVRRTREIGIRMALGADRGAILAAVLREGLMAVGIGVAVGAAAALVLARIVARLLFGVPPTDPITYLVVALLLIAVAALACLVPARRATALEPSLALRAL
jgi:predicted permease